MQVQSSKTLLTEKEGLIFNENGLIESTIVLAPDLIELPRLLKKIRQSYSLGERLRKLNRFQKLADKSVVHLRDAENVDKTYGLMWRKFYQFCLQKEDSISFANEGEKQSFMWILCTIFCDTFQLPDNKSIFYTGIGFGEFWALTYRMYQVGKISLQEGIYLSKIRGDRMTLLTDSFYEVHVRESKKQTLYALLPKNGKVGVLALKKNQYYLYGKKDDLEKVVKHYNVTMQESIPYFSSYLLDFANAFAKRFPCGEEKLDNQLIFPKEYRSIQGFVKSQFSSCADEEAVRREISFYEPNVIRRI